MNPVAAPLALWSDTLTMKQWEKMITDDVLLFSATNEELNTLRAAPTSLRKASLIGLNVFVLPPPPPLPPPDFYRFKTTHAHAIKSNNPHAWANFRRIRNKVNTDIKSAKELCYCQRASRAKTVGLRDGQNNVRCRLPGDFSGVRFHE